MKELQADRLLLRRPRFQQLQRWCAVRIRFRVLSLSERNGMLCDLGWTGTSARGRMQLRRDRLAPRAHLPEPQAGNGGACATCERRDGELDPNPSLSGNEIADGIAAGRYFVGMELELAPFHSCASCHQFSSVFARYAEEDLPVRECREDLMLEGFAVEKGKIAVGIRSGCAVRYGEIERVADDW